MSVISNILHGFLSEIISEILQITWVTDSIKISLKERSKLTKCYYKNGQKKSDHEKLLEKSFDCTKEILEAKNNYILKITTKLQDPKTAAKPY